MKQKNSVCSFSAFILGSSIPFFSQAFSFSVSSPQSPRVFKKQPIQIQSSCLKNLKNRKSMQEAGSDHDVRNWTHQTFLPSLFDVPASASVRSPSESCLACFL